MKHHLHIKRNYVVNVRCNILIYFLIISKLVGYKQLFKLIVSFLKLIGDNYIMNKKILTIAITCSFCFLLSTNYVVADKPESAGKPEGIEQKQAEREAEKAEREERKAEKEKEKALRKAEKKTKGGGNGSSDDD